MTDLWKKEWNSTGRPARGYNNTCSGMQSSGPCPTECLPGPKGDQWYGGYEDALFEQQVLEMVAAHDATVPLFLFWAPHIAHAPLQAPKKFIDHFDFINATDDAAHARQYMHAMVHFADAAISNVTNALKAKKMWGETLFFFCADNGGPISKLGNVGSVIVLGRTGNCTRGCCQLDLLRLLV
jgi:hypothetical protein